MVPNCHEEYRMQPLQLSHLARMMRMIETHDDVTMVVVIVIVIVIEVIREVVEVEDMSISTKIKVRPVSPVFTHLTCNCGGADINSTYRQCLVSMRNSTTYFTLFDTGASTSFVNREVQHGGTVAGAHHARSTRHDVPT